MRFAPFLFALMLFLSGCQDDGTRYHRYCATPSEGWKATDTLWLQLPVHFTYHKFAMQVGVRHNAAYPYRDLWLAVIHPLTPALRPDTIHLWLADEQGNWLGEGTANCLYQREVSAGETICFSADSVLQIVHLMKDSVLTGISDVGIKLSLPGSVNAKEYE